MTSRLARPAVVASTLFAAVLVGCGSVLDDARLQTVIQEGFQDQTGISVRSVDCPDGQPLAAGAQFECTLTTTDGETVRINVTQTDANGNVQWATVD